MEETKQMKNKENKQGKPKENQSTQKPAAATSATPAPAPAAKAAPSAKPAPAAKPVSPEITEEFVYLEEEIRYLAYLHTKEHGGSGDMDGDWYTAVDKICAKYKAEGYKTYLEDGKWWASRACRK